MPEKCENTCPGLTRLEQQVDDIRRQNGNDHKEFREDIADIRQREARQEGKLDYITGSITELKAETKDINNKLTPVLNKLDDVERIDRYVDELKTKPGKNWDKFIWQIVGIVVAAVMGLVLGRIGLS